MEQDLQNPVISERQRADPYFSCEYTNEFHGERDVPFRDQHPQQNVFTFKGGQ